MKKQLNKIPKLLTLKELRDECRYQQKDIVEATGLSKSMISRLLHDNDISNITYASAKSLAKWLGVSMEELGEDMEE